MNSHWSGIGIYSQKELSRLITVALESPSQKFQDSSTGKSYLLTDGLAELWVHIDAKCAIPSFSSSTIIKAKATRWIENENNCPYCATLCIERLNHEGQNLYPLAVTFSNVSSARQSIEIGKLINLALSIFIENVESWENVESYRQEYPDRTFGPNWFIPLGPFSAIESTRDNRPRAAFFGVIKEIHRKKNPWTNHYYQYLLLECSGIMYEVVISEEILGECSVDNLLYVECWLCAKHIDV